MTEIRKERGRFCLGRRLFLGHISLLLGKKFHVDLRRIFFFLQRIRGAAMVCCAHQHPHYCHLKIIPF